MNALKIAALMVLATCQQVCAEGMAYRSDVGDVFLMSCNPNGYVLTLVPDGDKVYMGKDCDAYSTKFGGGSWCTANAGFAVTVGPLPIIFPGQEPYCPGVGYSPFFCSCGE